MEILQLSQKQTIEMVISYLQSKGLYLSASTLEMEAEISVKFFPESIELIKNALFCGYWKELKSLLQPFMDYCNDQFKKAILFLLYRLRVCELLLENVLDKIPTILEDIVEEITECYGIEEYEKMATDSCSYYMKMVQKYSLHFPFKQALKNETFHMILKLIEPIFNENGIKLCTYSRLPTLLAEGLLYNYCSELCYRKACGNQQPAFDQNTFLNYLKQKQQEGLPCIDININLYSWICGIKDEKIFQDPFFNQEVKLLKNKKKLAVPQEEDLSATSNQLFDRNSHERSSRNQIVDKLISEDALENQEQSNNKNLQQEEKQDYFDLPHCNTQVTSMVIDSKKLHHQTSGDDLQNREPDVHDSYAAFLNEQKNARDDYKKFMEKLQIKQKETQEIRNILHSTSPLDQIGFTTEGETHTRTSSHLQDSSNQIQFKEIPNKMISNKTFNIEEKADRDSQHHIANDQLQKETLRTDETPSLSQNLAQEDGFSKKLITVAWKTPRHLLNSYVPVERTEDPAVIRSVAFHPNGNVLAVGSNSHTLKLCAVPTHIQQPLPFDKMNVELMHILSKRSQVHHGSIYSLAWSDQGNILATCSNDKLIKIFTFDLNSLVLVGPQYELSYHSGMVRDVTFFKQYGSGSLLASGGASDFVIYTYACDVDTVVHQLTGHSDQILSLYSWGAGMLASASQDRSVRVWDLRSSRCVSVLGFGKSDFHSVPTSVCVDTHAFYMAVGREDSIVSVYDLRAGKTLQDYMGHSNEVRGIRFNPTNSNLLLSSSYDGTALVTDISSFVSGKQLDLQSNSFRCCYHNDKVIQCRWHPNGIGFATTSADQSCVYWTST